MRNFVRTSCLLATVLTFGFTACGDDNGTPASDTSTTDTSVGGDTTTTDTTPAGDTTAADTTPVDPCDPNPCNVAPAAHCNEAGDAAVTYTAPGTCTVSNNAASCAYTNTTTACTGDDVCANGACRENPTEYTPGPASYVSELAVGDQSCCDQDGNGTMDNKLGQLLGLLGGFPQLNFNVEEAINDAIEAGSLVLLFDYPNLSGGVADQTALEVRGFVGDRADDHETSIAGNGSFTVSPSSFVPGTLISQIELTGGIGSGQFSAGPSNFTLSIPLDDFGTLSLSIINTTLESTVSVGANGTGLTHTDGKLAGVIPFAEFVGAFNGLTTSCDCFNLAAGAVPFEVKTTNNVQGLGCTAEFNAATPTCNEAVDGSLCSGIGDNKALVCGVAAGLLTADIDWDEDGVKDSMSAFLTYGAVSATITGVTTTE